MLTWPTLYIQFRIEEGDRMGWDHCLGNKFEEEQ